MKCRQSRQIKGYETFSINRRTFLKGAASVAGVSLLTTLGCESTSEGDDLTSDSGSGDDSAGGTDSGQADTSVHSGDRSGATLFLPATIGTVELKNRILRSATEEAYCKKGVPTSEYTKVFTDLAAGGAGAIISGIAVSALEDSMPFMLYAYDDEFIERFAEIRQAVRDVDPDCKVFAQVGHTGHRYSGDKRIGPTDKSWPGDFKPMRAMDVEEIAYVVEQVAQTIRRFKDAGWDGVEIHGGHGYLISSFLSPYTNTRTDEYGGSVQARVQIVKDLVDRSRELVGDDYPIFIKFNSDDRGGTEPLDLEGGIDQKIFIETANELAKMKIDAIDVSGNDCSQFGVNDPEEQSYFKDAAIALEVDIPVILTGGNRDADDLTALLDTGEVDFIGISRPLIREPDLANKWLSGQTSGTACISCNQCTDLMNLIGGMRCHAVKS